MQMHAPSQPGGEPKANRTLRAVSETIRKQFRWYGARVSMFERYQNALGPLVNGRYVRYADECRALTSDECDLDGVRSKGSVLVRDVMNRETALGLSNHLGQLIDDGEGSTINRTAHLMKKLPCPITALGREVIDIFHQPELDAQIRGYFGSHYRVQWLDCYRSFPTDEVSSSWLWHCDNVPAETLKVMLHLTDAGKDLGATQFMTMDDSIEYYRHGYRGQTSKRIADLEPFAEAHQLPYRPFHHESKAGDVMLFNNNALHKAVPPRAGYRDVLTYLLLPNPIPWHEQLERDGIASIEANPGGYPRQPIAASSQQDLEDAKRSVGKAAKYERTVRSRGAISNLTNELINLRHSSCRRYWIYRATGRNFADFYSAGMDRVANQNPENATGRPEQKRFQLDYLVSQGLEPKHSLLDFGCGAGSAAVHFVGHLNPERYVGADISAQCLEVARQRMHEHELDEKRATFVHLDAGSTEPLVGRKFDFIWAQSVLTHMPPDDIVRMLERLFPLMHGESKFFATFAFTDGDPLHHKHVDWYYNPSYFEDAVSKLPLKCSFPRDWIHPASDIDRMVCFEPREIAKRAA